MRLPDMDGAVWPMVMTGATIVSAVAVRQGMKRAYQNVTGESPPDDPSAPEVGWGEALTWGLASGAVVAIGRLVAKRAAAGAWKVGTGHAPPRS